MKKISIIVPIMAKNIQNLNSFCSCYNKLSAEKDLNIFIIDNSEDHIFNYIQNNLNKNISHTKPDVSIKNGKNKKMINVQSGIMLAKKYKCDVSILFDDDMRPTLNNILDIKKSINRGNIFCCMIDYKTPDFFDLIDLSGIYLVNFIFNFSQIWGNIGFDLSLIEAEHFDTMKLKDSMYDELTLKIFLRSKGGIDCYFNEIRIPMLSSQRNIFSFLEQRIRYAYENIGNFWINTFCLSIIPLFISMVYFLGFKFTLSIFIIFSLMIIFITYTSSILNKYDNKFIASLFSVIWFYSYSITSWIANFIYIFGGYRRNGNLIKRSI